MRRRFWDWTTSWVALASVLTEIVTFRYWKPEWAIEYRIYLIGQGKIDYPV